ncbi:MAG: hypothetical protein ABSC24_00005 [Verrucomicrobiota bacterium]|jgi:hypothetical protein
MKISTLGALLLVAVLANGCVLFHHHRTTAASPAQDGTYSAPATPSATLNPIVTPDNSLTARVATYNATGRFVVLSFPVGQMPNLDQTLFLYRNGLKEGEVKITGPQRDNDVVADLVTGTAQAGDEVREQ